MTVTEPELFRGYRPADTDPAVIGVAVLARIRLLWSYRRWWRENRWADWPVERQALEIELRALVRVARQARRVAAPDPIDLYRAAADRGLSYHDVQAW